MAGNPAEGDEMGPVLAHGTYWGQRMQVSTGWSAGQCGRFKCNEKASSMKLAASPDTTSAGTLILDFPGSRIAEHGDTVSLCWPDWSQTPDLVIRLLCFSSYWDYSSLSKLFDKHVAAASGNMSEKLQRSPASSVLSRFKLEALKSLQGQGPSDAVMAIGLSLQTESWERGALAGSKSLRLVSPPPS
ncbi:hypothetical protein AAY473_006765 [Plecturocebus cupreus]